MGNISSLFYPDNKYRKKRADELSNDCQYIQAAYESAKARIERDLGPYKAKLDNLLRAFGCQNIQELDAMVLRTATGDALENWKKVREQYDTSLLIDQIVMGAASVVTGLEVTADILFILSAANFVIDVLSRRAQRSKLRDAINQFCPIRLKDKYAQMQMEELEKTIPGIQALYQSYESLNYNQAAILNAFKKNPGFLTSLKTGTALITYQSVGQAPADQDARRGSWTNEDPNWMAPRSLSHSHGPLTIDENEPDVHDGEMMIKLLDDDIADTLSGMLHLKLRDIESDHCAKVYVNSQDDAKTLSPDLVNSTVNWATSDQSFNEWSICFVDPADATIDEKIAPNTVRIYMHIGDKYITKGGALSSDVNDPSVIFVASRA
ncbi:hypothetical protein C8Q75DRAFT_809890 [Abortiporus biennis]|nr:hypothetical protein C8Q75DRAFT_809890 [Abortiporus biennis]